MFEVSVDDRIVVSLLVESILVESRKVVFVVSVLTESGNGLLVESIFAESGSCLIVVSILETPEVSVVLGLFIVADVSVAEAVVSVVPFDLSVALYGDLQAAIPTMAAATIKNRNFI